MREKILRMLEKNSRIDLKDLAIMLGSDEVTVANEIARMEKENVICGYHTMINRVTPQRGMGFDKLAERIYQYEEVETVYLMSGGYDFTVILDGKTLREVSQFVSDKLSTLESVLSTSTHFVLKKYKEHGTILARKAKDERMLVTP